MEISTDLNVNVVGAKRTVATAATRATTKSNKRKQQTTPSSSQRSTSHPLAKRLKKKKSSQIPITSIKSNYRLPMYLKIHPNLLFRTLRLQLKHRLKKKNERRFLHHRLQLLDQHCRLDLHKNLWQSYIALGSKEQVWPVSLNILCSKGNHFFSFYSFAINKEPSNKNGENK